MTSTPLAARGPIRGDAAEEHRADRPVAARADDEQVDVLRRRRKLRRGIPLANPAQGVELGRDLCEPALHPARRRSRLSAVDSNIRSSGP